MYMFQPMVSEKIRSQFELYHYYKNKWQTAKNIISNVIFNFTEWIIKHFVRPRFEIAREAGSYIYEGSTDFSWMTIEVKGRHNFVTEVDKAAESNDH